MHAAAGAAAAAAARRLQRWHRLPSRIAAAATDDPEAAGMSDEEEEWVEIGRVGPPHGVRGEFKVQPLTDFPEERLGMPGPRWEHACLVLQQPCSCKRYVECIAACTSSL